MLPSVKAHHRVSGPNTGRNSGGRQIQKLLLFIISKLELWSQSNLLDSNIAAWSNIKFSFYCCGAKIYHTPVPILIIHHLINYLRQLFWGVRGKILI